MGRIVRTISKDASVVCSAIEGRDIVQQIAEIHKTSAVITAALGRLALGTSLIGFSLKGENSSVTIRIDGNGPAGLLMCVADSFGNVKGFVTNPLVEIPLNGNGKLDVGSSVGNNGTISVIKDMGLKEPYCGQTSLVSGEIAEDITNYLAVSEQTPSVCALGVLVNHDLTVKSAGGYLIQLLPFASEEIITQIENNITQMKSVTKLLEDGNSSQDIATMALNGLEPNVLDDFMVKYYCDCSRKRTEKMLLSLGKKQLEELSMDEITEIKCNFCNKSYNFTSEDILNLKNMLD